MKPRKPEQQPLFEQAPAPKPTRPYTPVRQSDIARCEPCGKNWEITWQNVEDERWGRDFHDIVCNGCHKVIGTRHERGRPVLKELS